MASWSYRPATRLSWFTGLPTRPAKPCAVCKGGPSGWVAYEYTSGRKGRVATGYRSVCAACSASYCERMNARAARDPKRPDSPNGPPAPLPRPEPEGLPGATGLPQNPTG